MAGKRLSPQILADLFFYHQDEVPIQEISKLTGINKNTIASTISRIKKYLKRDSNKTLSVIYREALKIIEKEQKIRDQTNKVAQIKNNLFRDLAEVIDGVVANIVEEKHHQLVEENGKLKRVIEHLQTQEKNRSLINESYRSGFLRK